MPPLGPIGDIGVANLSEDTLLPIVWETATDWDNSADEAHVVHEVLGHRSDASVIHIGHPTYDAQGSALAHLWIFDGDYSDEIGTATGNPQSGVSLNAGGGPTGLDYVAGDGSSGIDLGFQVNGDETWVAYTYHNAFGGDGGNKHSVPEPVFDDAGSNNDTWSVGFDENNANIEMYHDPSYENFTSSFSSSINQWYGWCIALDDGTDVRIHVDGSLQASPGVSAKASQANGYDIMGDTGSNGRNFIDGRMAEVAHYERALSDSFAAWLSDAHGYLETATKSFTSAVAPDLSGLTYNLDGASITIDVIGSPGTASEEVVSQTLDGSTSYTLSWSNTHTDFRVKPILDATGSVTSDPTVSKIELAP